MSGKSDLENKDRLLLTPCNLVYLYDGSLAGLYCCVYTAVYAGRMPFAIQAQADMEPSLMAEQDILTRPEQAAKVHKSISQKISPDALDLVETVFLSCMPEREMAILRFLLLGYQEGRKVDSMLAHPLVAPLLQAQRHLKSEQNKLTGFVRFSDYGGFLAATITPKNFILPFLAGHFARRYANEEFMIFDKTNKAALLYQNKRWKIVAMDSIDFPPVSEEEARYRALWKRFYKTIAIQSRENPRCRMTHMPKRYWENMLEVQDELLPEAQRRFLEQESAAAVLALQ